MMNGVTVKTGWRKVEVSAMSAFKDISKHGKCQVCGKETNIAVFASAMGGCSFAYCEDCAVHGYEPYGEMVAYISCAGRWPDDINEMYQELVRHNLKFHNKTEAEFARDVDHFFDGFSDYMASLEKRARYNKNYDFDEDF